MKAVFDAKLESQYDDDLTRRYHFPARYLRHATDAVGDWIVFRRPRDGRGGISYFATALLGKIVSDPDRPSYYYASIHEYLPFARDVAWRDAGRYAERPLREMADISKVGLYLRGRSIRPLEDEDFVEIVETGMAPLFDGTNRRRLWNEDEPTLPLSERADPARRTVATLTNRRVRDAAFRAKVLDAYGERCAFTRLRLVNGGGRAEVQAAHILPVAEDGPDVVQNGLALSATAHWLFDRHLVSINPEFRLLIAHNRVPTELQALLRPSQKRLHLPADARLWPAERFLRHHRERYAGS